MGTFDPARDAPDQIRQEGVEISVEFERTGATTGHVSWNIPPPADGCTADHQAYCGIVVVLNTVPNRTAEQPENGTRYTADPTASADLHVGDKIGAALVVGAFYDDKTTVSFDVTDLEAEQTYFFTAYAVSCELIYHKEGSSSYSLPYLYDEPTPDTGPFHEVVFSPTDPALNGTDATGLAPGNDYTIDLTIDGVQSTLTVNGTDAQTYDELVAAINKQIKLLENPPQSPVPPNTGAYYYETVAQKLFQWDGFQHVEIPVISELVAPNGAAVGTFWLDTVNSLLYKRVYAGSPPGAGSPRTSLWELQTPISSGYDPANPNCDSFWFDTVSQAYSWDGSVWCTRPTVVQTTDPSCAPDLDCSTYWYDETSEMLFAWDEETSSWVQVEAIAWDVDPNFPAVGTYWFNDTTNELFIRAGGGSPIGTWVQNPVTVAETAPLVPAVGDYWFQESTQELFINAAGSPSWVSLPVLIWGEDPTVQGSCDLWWNTATDVLSVWDLLDNNWTTVGAFFIQATDPSVATLLETGTVWVDNTDPANLVFWEWDGSQFVQITLTNVIQWLTNPVDAVVIGSIWYDSVNDLYYERTSATVWTLLDPIEAVSDPAMPVIGDFWYNTTNNTLNNWNGAAWVNVAFSTIPLTPSTGALWFDTTAMELMEWNGTTYVVAVPQAIAALNWQRGCSPNNNITFLGTQTGGCERIFVGTPSGNNIDGSFVVKTYQYTGDLFPSLTKTNRLKQAESGTDGLSGKPMYEEVGVGTTGDPAFRRELADSMRKQLGYPTIQVELTKYQINEAIQSALEELRSRSASAYRRVYFFLNTDRGTQNYLLSNKCVGYNTVVNVMGVWRMTSAFMSTVQASGVYGQTVLQHLYHMGTYDLVSYHLVSQYIEELEQLFATRVTYTWDEASRELYLFQQFTRPERVLIDCTIERTEQELLASRWTKTWIERYALSQCRLTLAEIRGKYVGLPGAGGGVSLNSGDLVARAEADMQICMDDIDNFVVNDIENLGIGSEVIIG